jgi:hypothetical protein
MKCNPTIWMELKLCQGLLSHMWNTTDLRTRLLFKNFCLPCRIRLVIYTISSLLIMIAGNNYAKLQNFSEQLGKMTSIPRRQRNHSPQLVVHTYNNSTKTLAHFAKTNHNHIYSHLLPRKAQTKKYSCCSGLKTRDMNNLLPSAQC